MKEPFMPSGIRMPWEDQYKKRTVNITIYSYTERILRDDEIDYCYYCDEEDCNETCPDALEDKKTAQSLNKDQPPYLEMPIDKITLQDILNQLPSDVKPSDVKISIGIDEFAGRESQNISFYYKKTLPADMEAFARDKAAYDKAYAEYEVKRKEYDEWVKEQEVKALEDKLAKLKNKKAP